MVARVLMHYFIILTMTTCNAYLEITGGINIVKYQIIREYNGDFTSKMEGMMGNIPLEKKKKK